MEHSTTSVIIMAGGLGKRMNSSLPKVLHMVGKYPMIVHVIKTAVSLNVNHIYIIVGKHHDSIKNTVINYFTSHELSRLHYILQEEPLGTGHAIQCAYQYIQTTNDNILILSGDTPLISKDSLSGMLQHPNKDTCVIMTKYTDYTKGLGRIILQNDTFLKIVEEKDASDEEKKVNLVNCGIYMISAELIKQYIFTLQNTNTQKEYYLTDLIGIIKEHRHAVGLYTLPKENHYELSGVNTSDELHALNQLVNTM